MPYSDVDVDANITATIDYMDGTVKVNTATVRCCYEIPAYTLDDKEHYTFVGWKLSESKMLPTIMPASNLTAYAIWRPDEYIITYYQLGLSEDPIQAVGYGMPVEITSNILALAHVDGYETLTYWSTGGTKPATMPAEDIFVVFNWRRIGADPSEVPVTQKPEPVEGAN